jgi:hypothetical protein
MTRLPGNVVSIVECCGIKFQWEFNFGANLSYRNYRNKFLPNISGFTVTVSIKCDVGRLKICDALHGQSSRDCHSCSVSFPAWMWHFSLITFESISLSTGGWTFDGSVTTFCSTVSPGCIHSKRKITISYMRKY